MKRRIETLKPYPFESDFSAPKPEPKDMITLTAPELSALIADAQVTSASLARDETLASEADKLSAVSAEMKSALSGILELATHLEHAAIDEGDRAQALERVRRLASIVLDGQGELFTK